MCKSGKPLAADACLPRKVNGNIDSVKYQIDNIHAIEILCEFIVFQKKGYIFIHDLAPCHNSKSTRTFQECSRMTREFARQESHRERLEYNEERD